MSDLFQEDAWSVPWMYSRKLFVNIWEVCREEFGRKARPFRGD